MLRNFRRNTNTWQLHCSLMVIYCSATVPWSTYSGVSHMWTRRIVRSVSVKANFKNTSFLFFSRMDMLWLYAIKEFEGMGQNAGGLVWWLGPLNGSSVGSSVGSSIGSTVALLVDPVLSHTDWPMFYIVMGWVVFLAITLAHYVKR